MSSFLKTTHIVAILLLSTPAGVYGEKQVAPRASHPGALDVDFRQAKSAGVETPLHFFQLACIHCQHDDETAAAREIRRAAKMLKKEAKKASGKSKQAINKSANELSGLALKFEQHIDVSIDALKMAFARAHYALAYEYQQRAKESWLRKKAKDAGESLKAASFHAEQGIAWIDGKTRKKTKDVFLATRELAKGLAHGTKGEIKHIGSQTNALGKEIELFGSRILRGSERSASGVGK